MASIDLEWLERSARLRYERRRWIDAAVGLLPLGIIVGLTCVFTPRIESTLLFGGLSAVVLLWMLWRGQFAQQAALPALIAGSIPLTLALCANRLDGCGPDGCTNYCMPSCMAGGLVAGIGLAVFGVRRRMKPGFWVAVSVLTLLVGSMGCGCVGSTGLMGLAAGFMVGFLPPLLRGMLNGQITSESAGNSP